MEVPSQRVSVASLEHDPVSRPSHYQGGPACPQCGRPVECIDVVERLGFSLGNVVKYIWRADSKGERLEQLRKALWYLQREVDREGRRVSGD